MTANGREPYSDKTLEVCGPADRLAARDGGGAEGESKTPTIAEHEKRLTGQLGRR